MVDVKDIGQGKIQLELPEVKQQKGPSSFKDFLKAYINEVDNLEKEADKATEQVVAGKTENIHQAMIAMEKAETSFQLMVETRNRIVRAYEEIMKMQG